MDAHQISGSMLHDLVRCEERVHLDLHGEPELRDPVSPFVQMLWRAGSVHEAAFIDNLGRETIDLRKIDPDRRQLETLRWMQMRQEIIVGGEIEADGLIGRPDMLRHVSEGLYVAGDVKLGASDQEGPRGRRLEYGVQVALYTDILTRLGLQAAAPPFIVDGDAEMRDYPLDEPVGTSDKPLAWAYSDLLAKARAIVDARGSTLPAMSAACKLCHWKTVCRSRLRRLDDLTLLAEVGRSLRDRLQPHVRSVANLATIDVEKLDVTAIPGVSRDRLARLQDRARLLVRPALGAFAREPIVLPRAARELFYDVEVDPMRVPGGLCYLHGVLERETDASGELRERFHAFFAETPDQRGEAAAFAAAWRLLTGDPSATVYFWSKYERTTCRWLQARHPGVCSADEVEALFGSARAIDLLFDVVTRHTEWPLHDRSIKSIAVHLGFSWRDAEPSGAGSIEWYDRWVREGDAAVRQRIIDYNEDDCVATRWVRDALPELRVGAPW